MNRERARLLQFKLVFLDVAVTAGSFLLAYWLRSDSLSAQFGEIYPLTRYLGVLVATLLSLPLIFTLLKVYEIDGVLEQRTPLARELSLLAAGLGLDYVLLSALVFSLKLHYLSRLLVVLFIALDFLILALIRALLWPSLRRRAHREPLRVLILGSAQKARELASLLTRKPRVGTMFLGFVVEHGSVVNHLDGHPVLGTLQDIESILDRLVVDEVLIAMPERSLSELEPLLLIFEQQGITARLTFDVSPERSAQLYLERLGDVPLLTFTTVPNNSYLLALKRVTDVAFSAGLLALTSPLFLIVPILVKLTSRGPVFYKQVRCGLKGREFTFYKFRSMIDGADEQRDEVAHLNEAKGPIFKISSDPRVTLIGRILRKTSIDELPQLFNVLKGEMSLVGPRPPLPQEVALYEPWQRRRMSMKPGLTCLWQVSGRSALSFDEWVDMDLRYIDTWSLGQDLRILLRTIPAVLSRHGAW